MFFFHGIFFFFNGSSAYESREWNHQSRAAHRSRRSSVQSHRPRVGACILRRRICDAPRENVICFAENSGWKKGELTDSSHVYRVFELSLNCLHATLLTIRSLIEIFDLFLKVLEGAINALTQLSCLPFRGIELRDETRGKSSFSILGRGNNVSWICNLIIWGAITSARDSEGILHCLRWLSALEYGGGFVEFREFEPQSDPQQLRPESQKCAAFFHFWLSFFFFSPLSSLTSGAQEHSSLEIEGTPELLECSFFLVLKRRY